MCETHERSELLLPMTTAAPGQARAFARSSNCPEHASELMDDALLLITELVTNSVVHGDPLIAVTLDCQEDALHVQVRDGAARLPRQRTAQDQDEGGRGLALVDLLSSDWGVEAVQDEHGTGKSVWFLLRSDGDPLPQPQPAAAAGPGS